MKTIIHITEVLSGGVLPVIVGICNGLADKYRFVVVYGIRFDTPQNIDEIFDSKVKLIPLSSLRLKMSIKGDLSAIKEIKQIVRDEKPDVIHIHSTKAGIDARIGLFGCKVTKYYTPHGFCFLRKDQNAFKHAVLKIMESILAKMCDGIIACGKYEYEEALKLNKNTILIENGLDTSFIDDIINETGDGEEYHQYTIYTAGRIGSQKNPELFNNIALAMPEYRFVWVGEGDYRNYLFSPNIEITGLLSRDNVIRLTRNFDCYLSTSLWEGLPIALMEAMYLGKKCVVSDVEGNNELVKDGKTGKLFKCIKDACLYIRDDGNYGEEARKLINENYSLTKMCEKYEKAYG